jgi:hypothetical protein
MRWFVTRAVPLAIVAVSVVAADTVFLVTLVIRCWRTPW